jgi:hypothetical protein
VVRGPLPCGGRRSLNMGSILILIIVAMNVYFVLVMRGLFNHLALIKEENQLHLELIH